MFEIYKPGQGATARWIAAAGLVALAAFGCFELYDSLSGHFESVKLGPVHVSVLVSGLAFVGAVVLAYLAVNQVRFVDYLIASEMELRKVSWPTKDELKRQTIVVIVTLMAFGLILLAADVLFAFGSRQLYAL